MKSSDRSTCTERFLMTEGPITWRISARADFETRLAGLTILARFEYNGLGFLVRAELRPGDSPLYGYGGHFEFYCFKYLLWDAKGANFFYLPT